MTVDRMNNAEAARILRCLTRLDMGTPEVWESLAAIDWAIHVLEVDEAMAAYERARGGS